MLQSALSLFLICYLLGRLDCTELTVKQGADATLQCSGHRDADAIMISWNKPDLQSDVYLLFFKDGQFQEELQHELFKGRVKLKDPDWKKTGDFSVILQHVTTNDAGTYECYAGYEGQKPELLNSLILKVEKPVQTEFTVKRGEDATLHCYGPTDATTILLRWEKPDLQSDLYVFYLRDGRPNENYELPRFKDRVKLKDPEWMKNGDFTVILENVSMNDAGIYECQAGYKNQKPQLLGSTNLTVEESGPTGGQNKDGVTMGEEKEEEGTEHGSAGLIVGLVGFVVGVVVGFVVGGVRVGVRVGVRAVVGGLVSVVVGFVVGFVLSKFGNTRIQ